jgi:[ribosomal protein S5]-alanine N-acetyltransferase
MQALSAPELRTARLRLRPVSLADLDPLHALWTDAEVRRFLWDDQMIPRERAAAEIDASIASFDAHGFGMWALSSAPENALAGFCGLRRFGEAEEVEVLYGLAPRLWGRGLATEAAREVLRFGFEEIRLDRIFGRTDPPNVASRRVLDRLGMVLIGPRREGDLEIVTYVLERETFAGHRPSA